MVFKHGGAIADVLAGGIGLVVSGHIVFPTPALRGVASVDAMG